MKPEKIVTRAYWYGFLTHIAFTGWYQDVMGLDKYLALVKEHWIDTHWAMYFVIFVWAVVGYQMLKKDL